MEVRNLRKRLLPRVASATVAGAGAWSPSAHMRASDTGLQMGCYFDAEAFRIGMEMLSDIGDHPGEWYCNGMLSSLWVITTTLAALNADFHTDLDTSSNTAIWVGAVPGCSSLTGTTPPYRPFIQGKDILSDNSESALAVGIRF